MLAQHSAEFNAADVLLVQQLHVERTKRTMEWLHVASTSDEAQLQIKVSLLTCPEAERDNLRQNARGMGAKLAQEQTITAAAISATNAPSTSTATQPNMASGNVDFEQTGVIGDGPIRGFAGR